MKKSTVSLDSAIHLARAVRWLSIEERALQSARDHKDEGAWLRVEATVLHHIPAELEQLIKSFSGIQHPVLHEARRLKAISRERGMEMLAHSKDGDARPHRLQVRAVDDVMTGIEVLLGKMG